MALQQLTTCFRRYKILDRLSLSLLNLLLESLILFKQVLLLLCDELLLGAILVLDVSRVDFGVEFALLSYSVEVVSFLESLLLNTFPALFNPFEMLVVAGPKSGCYLLEGRFWQLSFFSALNVSLRDHRPVVEVGLDEIVVGLRKIFYGILFGA